MMMERRSDTRGSSGYDGYAVAYAKAILG